MATPKLRVHFYRFNLGPGLAGGNMIAASSANKKIQHWLEWLRPQWKRKKGETSYGLVVSTPLILIQKN
jgi:hypothetical protein